MQPISGVSKERVTLWSGALGADSLRPGSQGRAMSGTGRRPAPRESPQLRERSGEVIVGYIWASPVSHPTTTEYRSKPRPALPDLPSLCRSSLAAIRAVLRLAVASCAVLAGCHIAAVYDVPICGCVRHEHIGGRIMAVAVMHIG